MLGLRETEPKGYIEIRKRIYYKNWLMWLWKMRSHTVHKPEAKEGWQHNCTWDHWLLRMGGEADGKSPSLLESSRTNSLSNQGSRERSLSQLRKQVHPSFAFWSVQPITSVKVIFLTRSANSNANLFQRYSQIYSDIIIYQLPGHPLAQWSWYIKLAIIVGVVKLWETKLHSPKRFPKGQRLNQSEI